MTENFRFKKKFGQNFLKNAVIVTRIADAATIEKNSLVIEIGPGAAALTKELCQRADQVLCYEIDDSLELVLDKQLKDYSNVDVIYDDFLKRNVLEDLKKYSFQHLYVVANLPYYITTPIITKLIDEQIPVEKVVVMVQKEVGERFTAKVGSRDYGSLTVFLNYYFEMEKLFLVGRGNFVPQPHVDSVVIRLTAKKDRLEVLDLPFFFQLVRDSFRFKRKNLRNNLKEYDLNVIESVLKKFHKDLTVRAEQLTLEEFVALSNAFHA